MTVPDPEARKAAAHNEAKDRLIVALDFPAAEPALALARQLQGRCGWVKVGMELYYAAGRELLPQLRELGYSLFLDLKLHDIPNTVAGAVRAAGRTRAALLTVHAAGGAAMLHAAAEAAAAMDDAPRLLAVTVLTSMEEGQLRDVGVPGPVAAQVLRLARLAQTQGVGGMVCSPLETEMLRTELGAEPELVVPGIRPTGAVQGDQSRTGTPADAIASGASRLVVGRPITRAADPAGAAEAILSEMAAALAALPEPIRGLAGPVPR